MKKIVKISESLKTAWDIVTKNLGFFLILSLIVFAINLFANASSTFASAISNHNQSLIISFLSLTLNALFLIIGSLIYMNVIRISLDFLDEGTSNLSKLTDSNAFGLFLKTYLLYILIVIGGFILLIIPGIYWGIKYRFAPYLVVDKGLAPVEALKQSAKITDGAMLSLLGFSVLMGLIILAGITALFVGVFLAYPLVWIAEVFIYRDLLVQTKPVPNKINA
jgi:uncharacterized membrane protein